MTKRTLLFRLLFAVYLLAIAYICFASQGGLPSFDEWSFVIPADKMVHFTMFLPFPVLLFHSMEKHRKWHLILVVGVGCVLAATTELVQALIPYRAADLTDFLADSLGLLCGTLIFCLFSWRRRETR